MRTDKLSKLDQLLQNMDTLTADVEKEISQRKHSSEHLRRHIRSLQRLSRRHHEDNESIVPQQKKQPIRSSFSPRKAMPRSPSPTFRLMKQELETMLGEIKGLRKEREKLSRRIDAL